ncbi:hypothetical protein L6452_34418 [Arctium lappa]|uniref:Uncharacterized protein n=1 Tax=Arctium lappa TaxID=4217 RepID=A0ACB8YJA5_ARCLA|nr:hypothetical protein L6452_34418 [Arctium lappa]
MRKSCTNKHKECHSLSAFFWALPEEINDVTLSIGGQVYQQDIKILEFPPPEPRARAEPPSPSINTLLRLLSFFVETTLFGVNHESENGTSRTSV